MTPPEATPTPPATLTPLEATTTPVVTTSAPTVATRAPSAPGGAPPGLIGTWVSSACDTRTYRREIRFARDGKVDTKDLISPCAPRVQCIWSGIVDHHGTYTVDAGAITMDLELPADGPGAGPFPTSLEIEKSTSAPVETTAGARCVYTKK